MHVADREGDIYELFCAAQEAGTHFLIRTCVDRLAGDGDHTIADEMDEVAIKGVHRIEVRDSNGDPDEASPSASLANATIWSCWRVGAIDLKRAKMQSGPSGS